MTKRKKWTDEEEKFLVENYNKMTYGELSEKLGRSEKAIRRRARKAKLGRKKRGRPRQERKRKETEFMKRIEAERAERRRLREARKRQREVLEAEAHGTPELLLKFAEQFQVGDTVRVTFRRAHRAWRTYDGRILEVHDRFILVQLPAWKESVNFGSLIDGTVKVLKREQRRAG